MKTKFYCQECGYESPRWLGRCPSCQKWNSFAEEEIVLPAERTVMPSFEQPRSLSEIEVSAQARISTQIGEFNRVLGGGIVQGQVILIGGEPGIGKSTLLLKAADFLGRKVGVVLYVSGEESSRQVKLRASRLGLQAKNLYVVCETNLEVIKRHAEKLKPVSLIVDSIQTMFWPQLSSSPGSVTQVRECAAQLMYLAKSQGVSIFIVGHVTKEGSIAGPRVLEHIVDTVLYFEGDVHHLYRVLRTSKNRFGPTNEIGVFEMKDTGLEEILNPSQIFLQERTLDSPGSVVVAVQEGERPILLELQALVTSAKYGLAQRRATGVDYNRLSILLAVLEKRAGLGVQDCDVFVNVVGGMKTEEPAVDLGIILAVSSSFRDVPLKKGIVACGEVGLAGEIRAVNRIQSRVKEAKKLGFTKCIIPGGNCGELKGMEKDIALIGVRSIKEAIEACI